jgi:hypothetical protein
MRYRVRRFSQRSRDEGSDSVLDTILETSKLLISRDRRNAAKRMERRFHYTYYTRGKRA